MRHFGGYHNDNDDADDAYHCHGQEDRHIHEQDSKRTYADWQQFLERSYGRWGAHFKHHRSGEQCEDGHQHHCSSPKAAMATRLLPQAPTTVVTAGWGDTPPLKTGLQHIVSKFTPATVGQRHGDVWANSRPMMAPPSPMLTEGGWHQIGGDGLWVYGQMGLLDAEDGYSPSPYS